MFLEDTQIKSMKDRVKSPEMISFINIISGKPLFPLSIPSSVVSLSDGPWNKISSNDALFEVDELDIIVDTERIVEDSPSEQIIHAAGLTKKGTSIIFTWLL